MHSVRFGSGLAFASALWLCACGAEPSSVSRGRGTAGSSLIVGAAASGSTRPAAASGSSGQGGLLVTSPSGLGSGSGKVCASAVVQTVKTVPTIAFVIDGSGSMCAPFGSGSTRWQALRSALLDPSKGLVQRLQSSVKFGATLYDGTIDLSLALGTAMGGAAQNPACSLQAATNKATGQCPQLLETPLSLNNAMAIDRIYPAMELGGSTPTDKALNHVMDLLVPMVGQQGPDGMPQGGVYVILATDGAPNDICVGGVGGDGSAQRQGVITAVDRGAAAGITTWVISLAGGDAALQAHLDEVARHGDPRNGMARTFSPTNPDELIMTLAQLLGGAVGCHIALNGTVTVGQECAGSVQQNGAALACCQAGAAGGWTCDQKPTMTPSGWHLSDAHSIELVGDACTKFLLGSGANLLSASFPCEVFVPN